MPALPPRRSGRAVISTSIGPSPSNRWTTGPPSPPPGSARKRGCTPLDIVSQHLDGAAPRLQGTPPGIRDVSRPRSNRLDGNHLRRVRPHCRAQRFLVTTRPDGESAAEGRMPADQWNIRKRQQLSRAPSVRVTDVNGRHDVEPRCAACGSGLWVRVGYAACASGSMESGRRGLRMSPPVLLC